MNLKTKSPIESERYIALTPKTKRILKAAAKYAIAGAALYYVFSSIELREVWNLIRASRIWLFLPAVLLFTLSKLISAFRLHLFFCRMGLQLSHVLNIKLYMLGMFYNLFLPGGIGGDAYKIYLLNRWYKKPVKILFGAVFVDRISGMLALSVLALLLFSWLSLSFNWNIYALTIIPLLLFAFYLFLKFAYPSFLPILLSSLSFSFLVQICQLISVFFIIQAISPENQHFMSYLLVFLFSSIVAILPISIGGVGLRELTFLYGAQLLGIDQNLAIGISLVFYLITLVVSFPGIYFVFKPLNGLGKK